MAFNLHPRWAPDSRLEELEKRWKKPVRVGNDADVAGYGAIKGEGVELVLTLGTGMGPPCSAMGICALGWNSATIPGRRNLRGLHRPAGTGQVRKKEWNVLLQAAIAQTDYLFNWDHLYLGGGNTRRSSSSRRKNVTIVSNEKGKPLGGDLSVA